MTTNTPINVQRLPDTKIALVDGRSVMTVNGAPVPPMSYTCNERIPRDFAKRLGDVGIRVFYLWVDSGWCDHEQPDYVWSVVEQETETILEVVPDAYVILRTACHPSNEWLDANPSELVTFEDGRTDHYVRAYAGYGEKDRMQCLASRRYAEDCGEYLKGLVHRVAASPVGHRVIGYFLVGGGTGEWYYPMSFDMKKHTFGYSPAFKSFFAEWLRRKYGSDEALKKAWSNPQSSLDDPHIPSRSEHAYMPNTFPKTGRLFMTGSWGNFLDPAHDQCLADFYEARAAGTAASIEDMASVIKKETAGRLLVGAFWGNLGCTFFHYNSVCAPMCLERSPHVDFISSPQEYEDRLPGGAATFRSPVDSLSFRGKLFVNESDSRTHHANWENKVSYGGTYTLQDSIDTLKRDFAQVLCDDVNAFWFDQIPGPTGQSYYDDPDILQLFDQQQALAREYHDTGRGKVSEIAVVYDQDSLWHIDPESCKDLVWLNRTFNFPRIGAPCDHFFHDDFELDNIPEYKCYIFINCFHLDATERQRIAHAVKRDGKTALWVYAAGLIDPSRDKRLDLAHMSDLTGFGFEFVDAAREATFQITNPDHELSRDLSPYRLYGNFERPMLNFFDWKHGEIQIIDASLTAPLIYVDDPEATTLGKFVTNDESAFAVRDFNDWRSVWVGSKVVNAAVMRSVAAAAGAHIYLDTDDVVYANRRFVAVHATVEDRKWIRLPRQYDQVTDAYTNDVIATNTDDFDISMRAGETRMFRIE